MVPGRKRQSQSQCSRKTCKSHSCAESENDLFTGYLRYPFNASMPVVDLLHRQWDFYDVVDWDDSWDRDDNDAEDRWFDDDE